MPLLWVDADRILQNIFPCINGAEFENYKKVNDQKQSSWISNRLESVKKNTAIFTLKEDLICVIDIFWQAN